jgi:hypothetical protein
MSLIKILNGHQSIKQVIRGIASLSPLDFARAPAIVLNSFLGVVTNASSSMFITLALFLVCFGEDSPTFYLTFIFNINKQGVIPKLAIIPRGHS